MNEEKKEIRLIALDLDGTLLDPSSAVTEEGRAALWAAHEKGIETVVSTGRPLDGILPAYLENMPFRYAITTNGAAVYRLEGRQCVYSRCMNASQAAKLCRFLVKYPVYFDVFIDGSGFSDEHFEALIPRLGLPPALMDYLSGTRRRVPDIAAAIREMDRPVQKITMNFPTEEIDRARETIRKHLEGLDRFSVVSGGFNNLEVVRAGVNKGKALRFLSKSLGIDPAQTMAVGDSENDLDIIQAAGVGVAMGNAEEKVKAAADLIAPDNAHEGAAWAVRVAIGETGSL